MGKLTRQQPFQQKLLVVTAALLCALFAMPSPSFAACIAGLPCTGYTAGDGTTAAMSTSRACDADFMNQITAKATLEAQREMIVNQVHIAKPDSVLEYSCFDEKAKDLASAVDSDSVKALARTPIESYISGNFGHSDLGGKISGGSSDCYRMQMVWNAAKCANMISPIMLSFEDLASGDPRILPSACSGSDNITAEIIAVAENKSRAFRYASMDPVESYIGLTKSPEEQRPYLASGERAKCGAAIKTGVRYQIVDRAKADKNTRWYNEYTCSNPSCSVRGHVYGNRRAVCTQ